MWGVSRIHINIYNQCIIVKEVAASDSVLGKVKNFTEIYGIDFVTVVYIDVGLFIIKTLIDFILINKYLESLHKDTLPPVEPED